MLSSKHAVLAIKILSLFLVAALSFFVATEKIPEASFVRSSYEHVDENRGTVMKLSAATLSTSLAMSALPDDFSSPLAKTLSDMNIFFVGILVILFLEEILILYGIKLAFAFAVPVACGLWLLSILLNMNSLKNFGVRLIALGLAVAFVVPCSTHITEYVAADLTRYVESTIQETEDGANKLNEAMDGGTQDQSMFEKLSDLFQTAIRDISDLMLHFQNTIRRCMNTIAILILTNCVMPLLTFFVLRWVLKETFHIVLPAMPIKSPRGRNAAKDQEKTEIAVGGE